MYDWLQLGILHTGRDICVCVCVEGGNRASVNVVNVCYLFKRCVHPDPQCLPGPQVKARGEEEKRDRNVEV